MNKKKMELIKFLGFNESDKSELIFEGNNWYITFDRYHFMGTIENRIIYSFHYNRGYGDIDIISGTMDRGNMRKYHENSIPASIPKYIIEKIKEIAYIIINTPEYYIELNKQLEKTRKKCYEVIKIDNK